MKRICYICKIEKDLESFPKNKTRHLGHAYECKECRSTLQKPYQKKYREIKKEVRKKIKEREKLTKPKAKPVGAKQITSTTINKRNSLHIPYLI